MWYTPKKFNPTSKSKDNKTILLLRPSINPVTRLLNVAVSQVTKDYAKPLSRRKTPLLPHPLFPPRPIPSVFKLISSVSCSVQRSFDIRETANASRIAVNRTNSSVERSQETAKPAHYRGYWISRITPRHHLHRFRLRSRIVTRRSRGIEEGVLAWRDSKEFRATVNL